MKGLPWWSSGKDSTLPTAGGIGLIPGQGSSTYYVVWPEIKAASWAISGKAALELTHNWSSADTEIRVTTMTVQALGDLVTLKLLLLMFKGLIKGLKNWESSV